MVCDMQYVKKFVSKILGGLTNRDRQNLKDIIFPNLCVAFLALLFLLVYTFFVGFKNLTLSLK